MLKLMFNSKKPGEIREIATTTEKKKYTRRESRNKESEQSRVSDDNERSMTKQQFEILIQDSKIQEAVFGNQPT